MYSARSFSMYYNISRYSKKNVIILKINFYLSLTGCATTDDKLNYFKLTKYYIEIGFIVLFAMITVINILYTSSRIEKLLMNLFYF